MSSNISNNKAFSETSYLVGSSISANNSNNEHLSTTTAKSKLKKSRRLLYLSHAFAQFADAAWQFCIVMFLAAFTDYNSLLLVSTYGLVSGLTVCMFGSMAGQFVDRTNRLVAAQRFIWIQNLFVLLATLLCYILLTRDYDDPPHGATTTYNVPDWIAVRLQELPVHDSLSISLLVGIHICGSVAEVLNQGFSVAIEKDWIVVMAKLVSTNYSHESISHDHSSEMRRIIGDKEREWLSTTNVTLKQIDLSCKICAPAIAGFMITAFHNVGVSNADDEYGKDLRGAAVLVGCLNISALIVEYICTAFIYINIPELAKKHDDKKDTTSTSSLSTRTEEGTKLLQKASSALPFIARSEAENGIGEDEQENCNAVALPQGMKIYMKQPIAWGGIGFALLYLNALTFGGLMTAYLVWRGMKFSTVGIWRGVSSAIGLFGTVAYHFSRKHVSIESTGMWSITFQFLTLSLAYASLFFEDYYVTSLAMLIGGVCLSRVGLWVFDIAITQLMQEYIPAPIRGVTGGVQQSLNAFFGLLTYVVGICFPDPSEFFIYVAAGYASVGIAMIMYCFSIFCRKSELRSRSMF
mmetsp:Transcript_4710/g.6815  ORF Transcript_4710/g.6815 Transcript_4710/m.6815 type:complete len:579 (-) Transcript_4710:304-2040(-)